MLRSFAREVLNRVPLARRVYNQIRRQITGHGYRARRHIPIKRQGELGWWRDDVDACVRWFRGETATLHGCPAPTPSEMIHGSNLRESAVLTFIERDRGRYLKRLGVRADFLAGKLVLEIGCGPIESAMCFEDCTVIGLDPLLPLYKEAGYPLRTYNGRMKYLCARAEEIPLRDHSVDAVISVNAIDHVDDFFAVAREIDRVLIPGGVLRIETHYHPPTPLEPWPLNDRVVRRAFSRRRLLKISDAPYTTSRTRDSPMWRGRYLERLVVWAHAPGSR